MVVFSFLLWIGGGGFVLNWCSFFFSFLFLWIFSIILMSYLYYFNQIAKNIAPLLWGVKR